MDIFLQVELNEFMTEMWQKSQFQFFMFIILMIKVTKRCFQKWSNTLLKNIYVHSLNLLNFVHIVVVDVETTLEVAKLVIVGRFNKLEQISNFAALIIVLKAPSR